jgi:2-polyprenyl-3-methyl-5-hydroxy-6-metoxy-1,4-benzoquinol methylase
MSYEIAKKNFLPIDLESMRPPNFVSYMNKSKQGYHKRVLSRSGYRPQDECPVCQSKDRKLQFNVVDDISIYACDGCSLAYVNMFPIDVADCYEEDYFAGALATYDRSRNYRIERFGKERIAIIQKYVKSGDLLDIGCGVGWFLEAAMAEGFNVSGHELSGNLAQFTSEHLGIKVHQCAVSEIKDKFDVITLFDVIEHLEDPVGLLRSVRSLLNDGGIILIFTPNYDSLGIQYLKSDSSLVCPPAHLTYFTRGSVERLSDVLGMEFSFYETKGMDIGDMYAHYLHLEQEGVGKEMKDLFPHLQPIIDSAGAANHMRFILRKR